VSHPSPYLTLAFSYSWSAGQTSGCLLGFSTSERYGVRGYCGQAFRLRSKGCSAACRIRVSRGDASSPRRAVGSIQQGQTPCSRPFDMPPWQLQGRRPPLAGGPGAQHLQPRSGVALHIPAAAQPAPRAAPRGHAAIYPAVCPANRRHLVPQRSERQCTPARCPLPRAFRNKQQFHPITRATGHGGA
jgi:hypothetical protein